MKNKLDLKLYWLYLLNKMIDKQQANIGLFTLDNMQSYSIIKVLRFTDRDCLLTPDGILCVF